MGLLHLLHIDFDTETRLLRHCDGAVHDLQRLLGQSLDALLPDPVCIQCVVEARNSGADMCHHGQRDVEVVVGVRAPGITEIMTHLCHTHGTLHGPEVRVCQDNVYGLRFQ